MSMCVRERQEEGNIVSTMSMCVRERQEEGNIVSTMSMCRMHSYTYVELIGPKRFLHSLLIGCLILPLYIYSPRMRKS
jgi:hypothetical protein